TVSTPRFCNSMPQASPVGPAPTTIASKCVTAYSPPWRKRPPVPPTARTDYFPRPRPYPDVRRPYRPPPAPPNQSTSRRAPSTSDLWSPWRSTILLNLPTTQAPQFPIAACFAANPPTPAIAHGPAPPPLRPTPSRPSPSAQ